MAEQDDLRELVEEYLPRLGYQIMSSGPRHMPSAAFIHRNRNWVHSESTDWSRVDADRKLVYAGPDTIDGKDAYLYRGHDYDGNLRSQWYIAFYGINLVDIEDEEIEPPQIDNSEVRTIEVVKETNDTASFKDVRSNTSKAKQKDKEHTLSVTAETEFETQISRSAEANVGVAKGKDEFMARFRARIEAHTDNAWRESDRIEDFVEKEYTILPFTTRVVTVQEGNPKIRIKIPTKGVLDCSVRIDIQNANMQDFAYLDDIWRCWQGLLPGRPSYSGYFGGGNAVPQSEIDTWERPKLNLDVEVRGERVRYYGVIDKETVISGKDREYQKAKREYYKRG